ncbi:hypothetical protein GGTG_02342 [Gaeumannomyces tritici R3-111a-1]|uniref:Uncharacterized protein n=1 Tax=Gaeumannomyces tritici (strain R3-111a-1) TaxID=644352 RepID=J3NM38_GAET3|nr:hypothetical protein GGTG_02342 [Gaeumannomyces tritici R3-111a-1]EJT82369.1 hypothetical protein GGTG_02342 [Gaeumannomyces tritici R3-111a-1]
MTGRLKKKEKDDIGVWSRPQVRFGCSTISAIAEAPWPPWDHVSRVEIRRGPWSQWLALVLPRLPRFVQRATRAWFPGWFLPNRIVLKKLKADWDEEFDKEIATYQRLEELQGRVVPILYGEGRCDGTRCLLLSEVDGVRADQQKKPPIPLDEYKWRVEAALRELYQFDVFPTDEKLANTILTPDGGLVFVDLEHTGEREDPDLEADAAGWAYWYRDWLEIRWGIGRPPPPPPSDMRPCEGLIVPPLPPGWAKPVVPLPCPQPRARNSRGLDAVNGERVVMANEPDQ